jgi:hypothetical protein
MTRTLAALSLLAVGCLPAPAPPEQPPHVVAVRSEFGWCGGVATDAGVLTAWHCVDHAARVRVAVGRRGCWATPEPFGEDDIARLWLADDCPAVRPALTQRPNVGDHVRVVSPRGGTWREHETTLSGYLRIGPVERFSLPWVGQHGDSGSPIMRDGAVVCVVVSASNVHTECVPVTP